MYYLGHFENNEQNVNESNIMTIEQSAAHVLAYSQ